MKPANVSTLWMPLLLAWLVSVTGCATTSGSTLPPAPVPQVQLPALPAEAVPDPLPAWCLETSATSCSTRLQRLWDSWRQRLTLPTPNTPPAPPSTNKPAPG